MHLIILILCLTLAGIFVSLSLFCVLFVFYLVVCVSVLTFLLILFLCDVFASCFVVGLFLFKAALHILFCVLDNLCICVCVLLSISHLSFDISLFLSLVVLRLPLMLLYLFVL